MNESNPNNLSRETSAPPLLPRPAQDPHSSGFYNVFRFRTRISPRASQGSDAIYIDTAGNVRNLTTPTPHTFVTGKGAKVPDPLPSSGYLFHLIGKPPPPGPRLGAQKVDLSFRPVANSAENVYSYLDAATGKYLPSTSYPDLVEIEYLGRMPGSYITSIPHRQHLEKVVDGVPRQVLLLGYGGWNNSWRHENARL